MKLRYLIFAAALMVSAPHMVPAGPAGHGPEHLTTESTAVNVGIDRRTIVLDHMFFQPGGADIHPAAKPAFNGLAAFMEDNPEVKVGLSCETSPSWSEDCDDRLSNLRVDTVKSFLLDQGIQGDRIVVWRDLP